MTTRRHLSKVLALGLAVGLVAAACGDDDDDSSATTAPSTETTAATTETTAATTETTAATTETTAATTETTAATTEEAFVLDTAGCPAEATTPIPDGEPIKVAFVGPQTGPLAGFGLIGPGMNAYFSKINEAGGIDGHQIELIQKDDAYDAARTKPAVQELLEKDKIHISLIQVGTPNVASVRDLYEAACVGQAFVGTGFPAWGDPVNYPYTAGGLLAYNTEAGIWAEYVAKIKPGAKVGVLVYNNDFGKAYQAAFAEGAEENGLDVVAEVLHEPTSTLNNEITQLLAEQPDVLIGATTADFCGQLAAQSRQGGFEGPIIVSATCFSSQFLGKPEVGEAAKDVYGTAYLLDPTDPQYTETEAVKTYLADIEKYGNGANPAISSVATGYNFAAVLVDVLKKAAEAGNLSPAGIMEQVWNVDTAFPLSIEGGRVKMNGNNDAYPVETATIKVFDPATGKFTDTGDTFSFEGKTGLFGS